MKAWCTPCPCLQLQHGDVDILMPHLQSASRPDQNSCLGRLKLAAVRAILRVLKQSFIRLRALLCKVLGLGACNRYSIASGFCPPEKPCQTILELSRQLSQRVYHEIIV